MKRTLAILLAAFLTLSMFVIGASAAATAQPWVVGDFLGDNKTADTTYDVKFYDAAAETETELAAGAQLKVGMTVEAKVAEGATFIATGENPSFPLTDTKLKVLWFVTASFDASGNAVNLDPEKAGAVKADNKLAIGSSDIGKFVTAVFVYDFNDNNIINDVNGAVPKDLIYKVVNFLPVAGTTITDVENEAFSHAALLDLKVLDLQQLKNPTTGEWLYSLTALDPYKEALGAKADAVTAAFRAAQKAEKVVVDAGVDVTRAQLIAQADACDKAIKALADLAKAVEALADDIIEDSADLFDKYLEMLNDALAVLKPSDQVAIARLLAEAHADKFELELIVDKFFDEDTTPAEKLALAQEYVDMVDAILSNMSVVEELLKDAAAEAENQKLLDKIAELEEKIEELKNKPPVIVEVPVEVPVVVEPEWYELGIYRLLGVGGWGETLKMIVYYVFFGWRFGAYA